MLPQKEQHEIHFISNSSNEAKRRINMKWCKKQEEDNSQTEGQVKIPCKVDKCQSFLMPFC